MASKRARRVKRGRGACAGLSRFASADGARQGTGPKFVLVLGRASYRAEDLDAWVERETRAPSGRRFGR